MTALDLSRAVWRKSSRSNGSGACVEVATVWRKSSRSNASGACVEVASIPDAVAVRDSKDPDGPKLTFTPETWHAFVGSIKTGTYDLT